MIVLFLHRSGLGGCGRRLRRRSNFQTMRIAVGDASHIPEFPDTPTDN